MTRVINVTEEDIVEGQQRNARHCPIGRRLRLETGNQSCLVSHDRIYLGLADDGRPDWRLTSEPIARWLIAYDSGEEVHPFSFDLDSLIRQTPDETVRPEEKP